MAYALQSLLRIRARREDRASAELASARQAAQLAAKALEKRKAELRDFEETKEERRDKIYSAIIGHKVSMDDIDLAIEGVARIDEEGALKADNVLLAEAELRKKEQAAEEAREIEYRQETELEDFTGKKNTEDMNDNGY